MATREPAQRHAAGPQQAEQHQPEADHRAEVGLGDQQQRQDAEHRQHAGRAATPSSGSRSRRASTCAPQRAKTSLADLGGLEVGEAEVEPLARAVELDADARGRGRAAAGATRRAAAIGDQRRRKPAGSRSADAAARARRWRPRSAAATPGCQAGWSSSAASIAEAEKTMTRPMASSRPGRAEHQVAAGHGAVEPGGAERAAPRRARRRRVVRPPGRGGSGGRRSRPAASARTASANASPRCA